MNGVKLRHALAVTLVAATASVPPLVRGIARDWLETPDYDIITVYQSLLINSGHPPDLFEHGAYAYYLLSALWYRLLDLLGLLKLALLPPTEAQFEAMVHAGRWASLLMGATCAVALYAAMAAITRNRGLALGLALVYAAGAGLAMQSAILRPELAVLAFSLCGLAAALWAARSETAGLPLLAAGSGLISLAVMAKIQSLPVAGLAAALAAIIPVAQQRQSRAQATAWLAFGLALAAPSIVSYVTQVERLQAYHVLLPLMVVGPLACAAAMNRLPLPATVAAGGAVLAGFGLVHVIHLYFYQSPNFAVIANFLDHSRKYMDPGAASIGPLALVAKTTVGYLTELGFDLPVKVLALTGAGLLMLQRQWSAALRSLAFMLAGLTIMTAFNLRPKEYYNLFYEPWPVLAAALAWDKLLERPRPTLRRWLPAGLAVYSVVVLAATISNARPYWPQGHDNACVQGRLYLHRMSNFFDAYCR